MTGIASILLRGLCLGAWLVQRCLAIYVPDDQSPPAYCTVFGHIMKCGGSTIKWALETAQPSDQRQPGLCVFAAYGTDLCQDVAQNSAVIEGYSELARSPLENAGRHDCSFFTMMRHPIDRLVSQFFYCPTDHDIQNRPSEWCGDVEHESSLTDRLVQFASQFWGNHALRMMLFGITCPPQRGCAPDQESPSFRLDTPEDWDRLERAKVLLASYDAVGILEHWNLSMELYDRRIESPVRRWADVTYTVNAGSESPKRQELLKWAFESEEIRKIVQGDLLLYEFGLSIFKQQTAESLGTIWL